MHGSVFNILTLLKQKINRKRPYSTVALLSKLVKLHLNAGYWSLAAGIWLFVSISANSQKQAARSTRQLETD
jgi:hypothetical protein